MGKSTLMNRLVGERLSIITSKMQTTHHRILGIVNEEDYQIVFSDTPGIIDPGYKLHENMMKFVSEAIKDADILIVMTDIYEIYREVKKGRIEKLAKLEISCLVFINKIDQSDSEKLIQQVEDWKKLLPNAEILPISALHNMGADFILPKLVELLPEAPPYYEKDELTDRSTRFLFRKSSEKRSCYNIKKVPYSCEVVVEEFKEAEDIIRIRANIMVSRDSQKGILIGHKGQKIKDLGIASRIDIEKFVDKKVHLELSY